MGACLSSKPEIYANEPIFQRLCLTKKDVSKLKKCFQRIDKDGSGEISILEFLEFVGLDRTKFAVRAFSIFDVDKSSEIDFSEFVLATWNYCTFDKRALISFAFDLYDTDGSGMIDMTELKRIVQEVYGDEFRSNVYATRIMEQISKQNVGDASDEISPAKFEKFVQTHPALMFPAFRLQQELQKCILGAKFWRKAAKTRHNLHEQEPTFNWKQLTEDSFKALMEGKEEEKKKNRKKRKVEKQKKAKEDKDKNNNDQNSKNNENNNNNNKKGRVASNESNKVSSEGRGETRSSLKGRRKARVVPEETISSKLKSSAAAIVASGAVHGGSRRHIHRQLSKAAGMRASKRDLNRGGSRYLRTNNNNNGNDGESNTHSGPKSDIKMVLDKTKQIRPSFVPKLDMGKVRDYVSRKK
eukprot:TRINITY_DN1869_c0_g1_i1.p1 TRINITY_DN1869_c0_g1~~TRINITY_DN1869_c0_g1_i1.p1  ORF type:complete len:412 (-),score=108.95 TRINITY_DN1869_c0_g1_i1:274-1509(-)